MVYEASTRVWVMGYGWFMGYDPVFPAHQVGSSKKVWVPTGYGFSQVWFRTGLTVYTTLHVGQERALADLPIQSESARPSETGFAHLSHSRGPSTSSTSTSMHATCDDEDVVELIANARFLAKASTVSGGVVCALTHISEGPNEED